MAEKYILGSEDCGAAEVIENDYELCHEQSKVTYGNDLLQITEADIEALRKGKLLFFNNGEYGAFLILQSTEVTDD